VKKIDYLIWLSKLLAKLPISIRLLMARALANLLLLIPNRRRNRARENISRCLPELSQMQRKQLLRGHILHRCQSVLEGALLWHRPTDQILKWISVIEGEEILQAAHAKGNGVILAVPHFGQWELVGLYLSMTLDNTAILYKPLSDPQADQRLRQYRERTGGRAVAANASGIRHLLSTLRSGGYIGILPDQRPKIGQGLSAPFFQQPAKTMTLLTRIARTTGSQVVFAGCQRLSDGHSFKLRFSLAPDDIDAADDLIALTALNQGVEQCARWDLPQYQWSYNRFDF